MPESILVVAAHPDDEVLGCGGTIARHALAGDQVYVLILAEGATSRLQHRDRLLTVRELSALAQAAQTAGSILGATGVELLDLPDNRLDSLDRLDLIKHIEHRIDLYKPEVVYVHHAGDVNVDHRRLHEAVVTACRPVPGQVVKRLLSFEVASSTEWQTPEQRHDFMDLLKEMGKTESEQSPEAKRIANKFQANAGISWERAKRNWFERLTPLARWWERASNRHGPVSPEPVQGGLNHFKAPFVLNEEGGIDNSHTHHFF